jgi:hypothetical protein
MVAHDISPMLSRLYIDTRDYAKIIDFLSWHHQDFELW